MVTGSSDTLARLLVNEVLTTSPARPLKHIVLLFPGVIGNDGSVFLVGLGNSGSLLAAGDKLVLGTLRRITGAFGASQVLTIGTFFGSRECRIAPVACSSDAHANRFINTENGVVLGGILPF